MVDSLCERCVGLVSMSEVHSACLVFWELFTPVIIILWSALWKYCRVVWSDNYGATHI
jgi:hypothetical protein